MKSPVSKLRLFPPHGWGQAGVKSRAAGPAPSLAPQQEKRHQAKSQDFQRSVAATLARAPQVAVNVTALRALDAGAEAVGGVQRPRSQVLCQAEQYRCFTQGAGNVLQHIQVQCVIGLDTLAIHAAAFQPENTRQRRVIGQVPPVAGAQALAVARLETAVVDAVHGQQRRPHGEGASVSPLQSRVSPLISGCCGISAT